MDLRPLTVAIAGASGFVGRALAPVLAGRHRVVSLGRGAAAGGVGFAEHRQVDLLSLESTRRALVGVEAAIYLVHSMMPAARLTQGDFADLDLICADNFARAAAEAGVRHIVYLGGLMPRDRAALSAHLGSRLEVERVLAARGVPVTVLRAGLVLGAGGSSFELLVRLVRRLPVMVCPAWTQTPTQPVALDDVVALLAFATGRPDLGGRSFDVGTPDTTTYADLMRLVAARLGVRRRFARVPLFSPGLSRLWVSLITGAPRALVAPLVQSLRHEMLADGDELARLAGRRCLGVADAVDVALAETPAAHPPTTFRGARGSPPRRVYSVQRMTLPAGHDAAWASDEYTRWVRRRLRWFLRVEQYGDEVRFRLLWPVGVVLLALRRLPSTDRQVGSFAIAGGALARPERGRFELRQVPGENTLIAAVQDFEPRLPWWIYRATQAWVHALVMAAFRRHLRRTPAREDRPGVASPSVLGPH